MSNAANTPNRFDATTLPSIRAGLEAAMEKAGVSKSRRARISLEIRQCRHHFGFNTYITVNGHTPKVVRERAAQWVAKALASRGVTTTKQTEGFGYAVVSPEAHSTGVLIDTFCDMW